MSDAHDIFISYSHEDLAVARRFAEGFAREGLTVWWDASLRSGEAFDSSIESALRAAKAVVVLWSRASVESRWVRAEATEADRLGTLVPVTIEDCRRPIIFELTHTADLSNWTGDPKDRSWASLIADLRRLVERDGPEVAAVAMAPGARRASDTIAWHRIRAAGAVWAALLGLVLVALSLWLARTPSLLVPKAQPEASAVSAPVPEKPEEPRASVAVMPFANLTGDDTKEYFSDGMAEELIDALSHIPGLKVPARTSSFAYKGRNTDIRKIAQDLGVATILEGSVRSAGDRIRVTAQLVDAKTGFHLYSQSYDRKFADIFKLQEELAKSIVMALRDNLTDAEVASALQGPPTRDVEAYQLYLRATSIIASARIEALPRALELTDQAIARDPRFERAYALRAAIRADYLQVGIPIPNALADMDRDIRVALALDPHSPVAHWANGALQSYRGRWEEAEASYHEALEADARDVRIPWDYVANVLESSGRLREGLALLEKSYRMAPAHPINSLILAIHHSVMGHDEESIKFADIAVELGVPPDTVPLPQVYANAARRAGRFDEAARLDAVALSPAMRDAGGAEAVKLVYAALKDPAQRPAAVRAMGGLVRLLRPGDVDVTLRKAFIVHLALLGALDQAFDLVNRSLDQYAHGGTIGNAWGGLWIPEMREFRRDPRFQQVVARLNLPEYWKKHGPPDGCDFKGDVLVCR